MIPQELEEIRYYLINNCTEPVLLEDLEELVGLTSFQIIRLFRRHFKVTPRTFLIQQRIAKSLTLLEQGFPISEVALECGFYDQSHFHRHFFKYVKLTPRDYALKKFVTQINYIRN